jgi:acyl transferase domain-containing protein
LCLDTLCPPRSAGVFIGLSQLEYARIALEQNTPVSAYYATGAHLSVAAGRISFTWGLNGPAVAVDTACSSSLVTAHLAAASLQKGEVAMAAAGGVNLTLASSWSLACNRAGEHCKAALFGVWDRVHSVGCVLRQAF